MDLSSLSKLKKTDLVVLARKNGVNNPTALRKDELINEILKTSRIVLNEKSAKNTNSQSKVAPKKAAEKSPTKKVQSPPVTSLDDNIHESLSGVDLASSICTPSFESNQPKREKEYSHLPYSYNTTKLVAMVRDPYWIYLYWDLDAGMYSEVQKRFQYQGERLRVIIRMHDVTNVNFDGTNSQSQVDVDVDLQARCWFLYIGEPNRSYLFDLGLIDSDGNFFLIARSNIIKVPNDGPSDIIDDKWISYDFEEIYLASGGLGIGLSSGELRKKKLSLLEKGWVSSGMISSPMKIQPSNERDFFLEIGTEFILYGRTKPDATLTVEGQKVDLRPDGTFTLRYSLPDSHRILPVKAVSSDKIDSRTITVEIKKDTK
jgi:hypothetical protein